MRARPRTAALLLLLGGLLLGWLLWSAGRGGAGGGGEPGGSRGPASAPQGGTLAPGSTAPTLVPVPEGARRPPPRFTLTVRLLGLAQNEAQGAVLHLSARGNLPTDARGVKDVPADPSGTTVIDVEAMALEAGYHTLQVMADGPWLLPAYAALALPLEREERRSGLALSLDVVTEPAGALVGRVEGLDGKPFFGAIVTPDVWGGFANEEERGRGTVAHSDREGRFRVLARPGASLAVLALPASGVARASRPVALRAGEEVDVGAIRLFPPREWPGRVTGTAGLPPGPVGVRAVLLGPWRQSAFPGTGWTSDGPVRTWSSVALEPEGGFVLSDVATGWWRLQVDAEDWGCAEVHEVLRARERIAHTRDGPQTLDAARARMIFRTRREGKPLGGVAAVLSRGEQVAFRTDDTGYGCLVVRPDTTYDLVAYGPDLTTLRTQVTSAPNGGTSEVALALEPGTPEPPAGLDWAAPDRPRPFAVTVTARNGLVPAVLRLATSEGVDVPTVWVERHPLVTWRTDGHLLGRATADLVTDVKPGDYVLRVECPGLRPHEQPVRLPPALGEPTAIEVELAPE